MARDLSPDEVEPPPTVARPRQPGTFDRRAKHKVAWSETSDNWPGNTGGGYGG